MLVCSDRTQCGSPTPSWATGIYLQEQNEEDWSNPLPSSNNAPPEGPAWWVERSQAFNAHGISPRGKKGELQTPRDRLVS